MRILHVIPGLNIGGTEKSLVELCRGLGQTGYEHRVVALKSGGPAAEALRSLSIPVDCLESADGFGAGLADLPRVYRELLRRMRADSPAVVHTWLTRANVVGRLAARKAGVPAVVSSLRVMEEEKRYHLWAERFTQGLADVVTVNCAALGDFARQRMGIPAGKISLIPNGIRLSDADWDRGLSADFRKRWVGEGELAVGTVGRLHRQKGMDVFLEAARIVLAQAPRCRFLIAGDGPERQKLERQARQSGISEKVVFCGWVKDSPAFLASLDLFVLASRWEGMPNAVMEAMLLSRPVAAARVGGTPDLIEDGREGLLFPPEDPRACAAAILKYVNDPALRESARRRAQEKITRQFSLERMVGAYRKLYEKLAH